MEEKDPNEEELNPQGQDDANDADDSFGLPDLDYKALDEEENEPEAEPQEEEGQPESSDEEPQEETTEDEAVEEETSYPYSSEEETTDSIEEEEEKAETQYRYQVEETGGSNGLKIILGIIGILIVAAVIWFFGYYRPQQKKLEEDARIKQEQIDRQKAAEAEAAALKQKQEEAARAEEERLKAEAEALAKAGVQAITERTGRYYIVVGSFVDGDLAKDYGDKLAKSGTPSFLIPPYSKKKLQRVLIGGYETFDEAQSALNGAKPEGVKEQGNWILKY